MISGGLSMIALGSIGLVSPLLYLPLAARRFGRKTVLMAPISRKWPNDAMKFRFYGTLMFSRICMAIGALICLIGLMDRLVSS
jgi:hypothetical protein